MLTRCASFPEAIHQRHCEHCETLRRCDKYFLDSGVFGCSNRIKSMDSDELLSKTLKPMNVSQSGRNKIFRIGWLLTKNSPKSKIIRGFLFNKTARRIISSAPAGGTLLYESKELPKRDVYASYDAASAASAFYAERRNATAPFWADTRFVGARRDCDGGAISAKAPDGAGGTFVRGGSRLLTRVSEVQVSTKTRSSSRLIVKS